MARAMRRLLSPQCKNTAKTTYSGKDCGQELGFAHVYSVVCNALQSLPGMCLLNFETVNKVISVLDNSRLGPLIKLIAGVF